MTLTAYERTLLLWCIEETLHGLSQEEEKREKSEPLEAELWELLERVQNAPILEDCI